MRLPFLTARSQALPGELVIPRMGHSGPWGPVSWQVCQPLEVKRGNRRSHPVPGMCSPRHCGVLGPRDSRVPRISQREERLHLNRSSARPQLSRWPPPPRASSGPQTSRGADPRGRVKTGVRWGSGRDPLRPRAASHSPDLTHPARSRRSAAPGAAGPSPFCTQRTGRLRGGAGPGQGGAGDTTTVPPL